MTVLKAWIVSLRLRTLPLALSTIFMGSVVAAWQGVYRHEILMWAALTTLFLQILSNLANDYGDAVSGADGADRLGPQRMIQSGVISLKQMKAAISLCALLALVAGLRLLYVAFEEALLQALLFLGLGLAAIAAAIRYTVGSKPYGYRGLGDVYVFIFFGLLGVAGTYYLHGLGWDWKVLLPAASIGFFSAGVLNLNNLRDEESDRKAKKITLVVRRGRQWGNWYHLSLLSAGWLAFLMYAWLSGAPTHFWPLLFALPFFLRSALQPFSNYRPGGLDKELRNLSLSTLLFVALSALVLVIH